MPIFSTIRDLVKDLPHGPMVQAGRKELFKDEGTHSLFLGPLAWAAKRIRGKEPVENFLYNKVHRPLKNIDERVGKGLSGVLEKTPAKNLFRHVDVIPAGRTIDGHKALVEHETHSATAPLTKATKAVTPLLAAMAISNLAGPTENEETKMANEENRQLLKEAADRIDSLEKRDRAVKLAFSMVEKGKCKPFRSFEEFETKLASILEKDLNVVEEALALEPLGNDLGSLSQEKTAGATTGESAAEAFFHRLSS